MALVSMMPWGECLVPPTVPPPPLTSEVRHEMGVVPGWLARVAPCPWLVHAFTGSATKPWAYARVELWDLIALVVSQDNSCRYCYGVQRSLLKIFGYGTAKLARLERDFHRAGLSPAEHAVLEFARKLSRADPRPSRRDYAVLEGTGLGAPAIAEIAFAVATGAFLNRVATLLALPPEAELESLVERPIFRLMRPLIALRMRDRPRRPSPLVAPNEGLGARVVTALGHSPSAGLLRRTIDDAWSSEILPRRTKTLLLAVIAKALGCANSEAEARRMLMADGLDVTTVDDVLAHLGSPRLDAREAALVPFARETVRYQVADVQRRVREVTVDMMPEEVLEVVGVVSLANAICRLSVLLDVC